MKLRFAVVAALFALAALNPGAQPCSADPECIVKEERAKFPTPLGDNHVALLRGIAARLNAGVAGGPYGLLVKTSGNNCHGYACDIICTGQGDAQKQWDVLAAEEADALPRWSQVGTIAVRVCEFVDGTKPPPPPPPPTCESETELKALRIANAMLLDDVEVKDRRIVQLQVDVDNERAARLEVERRAGELEAALAKVRCRAKLPSWLGVGCEILR